MEPTYYLRVLRLRWKILVLGALVGMVAGAGTLVLEGDDEGPQTTYWLAKHKLIVTAEAIDEGRFPNLLQTALLVTGGDVPTAVAETLGLDETDASSRVRTVTDLDVNLLEISAVATDPQQATELADTYAAELATALDTRDRAGYDDAVAAAGAQVDAETERLEALDLQIQDVERSLAAHDSAVATALADDDPATNGPDAAARDELAAELRTLTLEREGRASIYDAALVDLTDLETAGAPAPLLETLDVVPAFEVSERLYNVRVAQGRQGANNFNARTIDDGETGGLNIGETVSNPFFRIPLGMVVGLLLAIGGVLLHLRFDQRLRTKAEVEEAFDLPVLAEIPKHDGRNTKANELHAISRSRGVVAESYRVVRSALLFAKATKSEPLTVQRGADDLTVTHDMRVVMVTSPGPSEGKTTTTANLAVLMAEAGYRVLVVNCDYRLPKLHEYFGAPHAHRRTVETGIAGVTLIADVADEQGTTNPTVVVETQKNLIRKARDRYDVVLLDTAPLLATNDALALLPVVDMVLLVAQEGKTDRESAAETVDLLRRRRADLAGVVLTGSTGFGRGRYYYKYRYGGYYTDDAEPTVSVPEPQHQAQVGAAVSAARSATN